MKRRTIRSTKKLRLQRMTIRSLDDLRSAVGGRTSVSLGNTRCSVTENGMEYCLETL